MTIASDGEDVTHDGEASLGEAFLDSSIGDGDESETDDDDDDDMFELDSSGGGLKRRAPLMRFVEESRRISAGNMLKWSLQVFQTVHRAHLSFVSFGGEITIDDVLLTPDVLQYASIFDAVRKKEDDEKAGGGTVNHAFLVGPVGGAVIPPSSSSRRPSAAAAAGNSLEPSLEPSPRRKSSVVGMLAGGTAPQKRSSLLFAAPAVREEVVRLMDVVMVAFTDDNNSGNQRNNKKQPWRGKNAFLAPWKWISIAERDKVLLKGRTSFQLQRFTHLVKNQYRASAKSFVCACYCQLPKADEVVVIRKELHRFNAMARRDLRALALVVLQVLLRQRLDRGDSLYAIATDDNGTFEDFTSVQPLRLGHLLPLQRLLEVCMRPKEEGFEILTPPPPPPGKAAPLCIQRFKVFEDISIVLGDLRKHVSVLEADKAFKKKSGWTRRDEEARQEEVSARREHLRDQASGAVRRAVERIEEEDERRRFFLLPDDEKVVYYRKKRAKAQLERNRKLRIKYLHQAAIYRWDSAEQFRWLNKAFLTTFHSTYDLKKHPTRFGTILVDKETNKKKLDVYQARQVEEVLAPMLPVIDTILMYFSKIINRKKRNHSQADVDKDFENMFFLVSKECAEGICKRCSLMTICLAMDVAREQADDKVRSSEVLSMIPRDQLQFKIVAMEADIFLKSTAGQAYREAFVDFEKRLALPPSQTWGRRMALAAAVSTITKYKKQANLREIGEALAASLLAACYRQNKVRRLINNIWKKAQAELQLQKQAEEEARKQRLLSGALLEGDLEGDLEFTGAGGKTNKFEVLEFPSCPSLEGCDRSLRLRLQINLKTSHYGPGAGQHKYMKAVCALLRRPAEQPDPLPARPRARARDGVHFPHIFSTIRNEEDGRGGVETGAVGDVAGEIFVVLYDGRQITEYAKLVRRWYSLSHKEGSLSLVDPKSVEEAMTTDGDTVTEGGCGVGDGRFSACPEELTASITYTGNRPVNPPDDEGVWTREGARHRAERSLLDEEGPFTDVETFDVEVAGLEAFRMYRVRLALSDIFVPRQAWERNLRYRWREHHRPGFYYPSIPACAVSTHATAPWQPLLADPDCMISDAAEGSARVVQRKGDRELCVYVGSGAITEKPHCLLVSSISWSRPYSGGAAVLRYELLRRTVLVCESALLQLALPEGGRCDERRLTPELIEQLLCAERSAAAFFAGAWESREVAATHMSVAEKVSLPHGIASTAHSLFERNSSVRRLVGCVEYKIRAVNSVGSSAYTPSKTSKSVLIGSKIRQKEEPFVGRESVYGAGGEGSSVCFEPVPGSELVVLAGKGSRGRMASSALLGIRRHNESQRVERPVDIRQMLADADLMRAERAATLVSSSQRAPPKVQIEGDVINSNNNGSGSMSPSRVVTGTHPELELTAGLKNFLIARPEETGPSLAKMPALERRWMAAGSKRGGGGGGGLAHMSVDALRRIPTDDLFADQPLSKTWWSRAAVVEHGQGAAGAAAAAGGSSSVVIDAAARGGAAEEHQQLLEVLAGRERERAREEALEGLFARINFYSPLR